jgi:hypothetical protein
MWTKYSRDLIACLAAAVGVIGGAVAVRAQSYVENLKRDIAAAELTLRREPYLKDDYCKRLLDGNHFLYRDLVATGKDPIVSFDRFQKWLAGRVTPAKASELMAKAKRRRDEQMNACNLAYLRSELAKATPQIQGGTDTKAQFNWNRSYGGAVLQVAAGTLEGSFKSWTFAGKGTNGENVTCNGGLDATVTLKKEGGAQGKMTCKAAWAGNEWECKNATAYAASSSSVYANGFAWFGNAGVGPTACVGTIKEGGKPAAQQQFGAIYILSNLGWPLQQ